MIRHSLVRECTQQSMYGSISLAEGQNHRSLGTKSPGVRQCKNKFWLKAIIKLTDSRLRGNDVVQGSISGSPHLDAIRCHEKREPVPKPGCACS